MSFAFVIKPVTYTAFEDEADQLETCKEWGLLSEKATKTKSFFYKGNNMNLTCNILGYVDNLTAVIELENKQLHCIHPSYLKEMQASTFSKKTGAVGEQLVEGAEAEEQQEVSVAATITEAIAEAPKADKPKAEAEEKPKTRKVQKLQLPEEKVKMSATVKEFTSVPNHFTEEDDEVIIYEAVFITEHEIEVGSAWSSHSATIKKLELEVGDKLTFEAKIAAKKLTKHPVPYKINNPSKIQKVQ